MKSFFSREKHTIYLTTYARGTGKPDHWAIFIATSKQDELGHILQIIHGRPFFEYSHRPNVKISTPGFLNKHVVIGEVRATKIDKIARALGDIPVVNDDEHWNCQSWTRDAILVLEDLGYVEKGTAENIDKMLSVRLRE